MKMILSLVCIAFLSSDAALAQAPVTLTVTHALRPGFQVPADFTGLSFEMQTVLPGANGKYLFRSDNRPLIALFRTLGIKSLRVGGNTADRPGVPVPGPVDIDSLFAFARAANVKVIYTLRLRNGSIPNAVAIAKYIEGHYPSLIACFTIGNEPNFYFKNYSVYRNEWKKYAAAITAEVPDAKFCGPSVGPTVWARRFADDFGKTEPIAFISEHYYPCGNGKAATNIFAARNKMLSTKLLKSYQALWQGFAPSARANGLPFRLEEINNFYNGGAKNVSNTFTSALWGLDFLHWWAAHGACGVNFHTGDKVAAAGNTDRSCWYATFWSSGKGYDIHPIGYAIKAFNLGGHGRVEPLAISNPEKINLAAYAIRNGTNLFVTIINKEHGANAKAAKVTIVPPGDATRAQVIFLSAPDNNLAAKTGVNLGGAVINDNEWSGKWTQLTPDKTGHCNVEVSASSAAIARLVLD